MNEATYRAAEERFWQHFGAAPGERWLDLVQPAARIRLLEYGDGPPLVFLHGGPAAASIFAPLAAQLSDYHCLIPDRMGCGLSPAIAYGRQPLDAFMADYVGSLLDALNLSRAILVGNSFGSTCAYWFARRRPERVAALIHLSCPAFVSQMQVPFMMKLLATPGLGYLAARLPMNRAGTISFMKTMGQQAAIAGDRLPRAFVDWWMALSGATGTMRNERELIRHGLSRQGMQPHLILSDAVIQAMDVPTYVYWGIDDPFATPQFANDLYGNRPAAQIDFIADSGHLPWFDDAAGIARRLRHFLKAAQATAALPAAPA